jgi:hypothetical protein
VELSTGGDGAGRVGSILIPMRKNPQCAGRISGGPGCPPRPKIAAMESLSPAASPLAPRRAARLAQVKFMVLPGPDDRPESRTLGPGPRSGRDTAHPRPGARILAFLARLAFRVTGRPEAARP